MDTSEPRDESDGSTVGIVSRTQMGWVCIIARAERLIATSLPMPTEEAAIAACGMEADFLQRDALLEAVSDDLRRYFSGEPSNLSRHPVDLSGHPPFYRQALLAARQIPYGEVRTYSWVAARAGKPRAARAAGQAMSHNPIPLVIPCHRVVASRGGLGGFGGGLNMKRALLRLEGVSCSDRDLLDSPPRLG